MSTATSSGEVRMRYAHLCHKISEELSLFVTLEHVMEDLLVPATGPGRFEIPSVLASAFVAYGGRPGTRELTVAFTDNQLNILHSTSSSLEFKMQESEHLSRPTRRSGSSTWKSQTPVSTTSISFSRVCMSVACQS